MHRAAMRCASDLADLGFRVFSGPNQAGTVSFVPETDCEAAAEILGEGIGKYELLKNRIKSVFSEEIIMN